MKEMTKARNGNSKGASPNNPTSEDSTETTGTARGSGTGTPAGSGNEPSGNAGREGTTGGSTASPSGDDPDSASGTPGAGNPLDPSGEGKEEEEEQGKDSPSFTGSLGSLVSIKKLRSRDPMNPLKADGGIEITLSGGLISTAVVSRSGADILFFAPNSAFAPLINKYQASSSLSEDEISEVLAEMVSTPGGSLLISLLGEVAAP